MAKATQTDIDIRKNELDSEFELVELRDMIGAKFNGDIDELSSFDAALAVLEQSGIVVEEATDSDISDGFAVVEKDELINVKMLFVDWSFNKGEIGIYTTVRAVTITGDRVKFSDGSTGLCEQLKRITVLRVKRGVERPNAGYIAPRGLSLSEYDATDAAGNKVRGRTFYLASSRGK